MRLQKFFLLTTTLAFLAIGCQGKDPQTPSTPDNPENPETPETPSDGLPDISTFKPKQELVLNFGEPTLLPYKGMGQGDLIELKPRNGTGAAMKVEVSSFDAENGISINAPKGYIGGMCDIVIHAGSKSYSFNDIFVNIKDNAEVDRTPGRTCYGRVIDKDGNPIAGVSVSDGVIVTTTNEHGCYYLASMRKNGYVFISVPSGYRVAVNRTIPQFFQRFASSSSSEYEIHNFLLEKENNVRHRVMAFTDCHLANRTSDLKQFNTYFKPDIEKHAAAAKSEGIPFYCITMGDLAWDEWWYKNSYSLEQYYATMSDLDVPIYNIPGNHDNDPYIANDFDSEGAFRKWIGPTYYSFNIGNIHYVMMDDTIFNNAGGSQGVVGNVQDYKQGFTSNEAKWLAADLALVSPGTTVVFGMHIQYSSRERAQSDGSFAYTYNMPAEERVMLLDVLAPFNTHLVTGHTHINYTHRFTDTMIEHNVAAVCGTWWWTGYYTSNKCFMCLDGSPAGYKIFDMAEDGKDSVTSRYQGFSRDASYQFRVYDLNNCLISRAIYCPKDKSSKVSDEFFSQYANGYDVPRSDNKLLVNVFDYDRTWKVSASCGGKNLDVKRVDAYDPLHVIHFNMNRMATNSTAMTFPTVLTSHMFEVSAPDATSPVTITVTDGFGREYVETVSRPRSLYDMSTSNKY